MPQKRAVNGPQAFGAGRGGNLRPVAIVGVGSTSFGRLEGQDIVSMAADACHQALEDGGVPRERIQALYLGNFVGELLALQGALAPVVASRLGMTGIPCTKVEGACASGGIALRHGFLSVALGLYDFVLVAGVEKMTGIPGGNVTAALSTAGDEETEMRTGLTFPGAFAMIMEEHMARFGTTREQIALVSVKNHDNGCDNPKAQFRKRTNLEEVVTSRFIAEPIRLFDCPPISDGAAAAIVCPAEVAQQFTSAPVQILGSGHASGPTALTEMEDLTSFPATRGAAQEAYGMSGHDPSDIDVAEVHDCFTVAEIIATEDLGFFPRGEGGPAVEAGVTQLGGSLPVNPSGGLIAKGHPVGATGLAQIYELVHQLRGTAANQVKDPESALAHNLGGSGAVATVHILGRV